jgi:hypothetical protein
VVPEPFAGHAPQPPFAEAQAAGEYYPAGDAGKGDRVITGALLQSAFDALAAAAPSPRAGPPSADSSGASGAAATRSYLEGCLVNGALCVRTFLSPSAGASREDCERAYAGRRIAKYGGSNAPFFTRSAMQWMLHHGVKHLLTDLPSVDKERDDGFLVAHRTFWGLPIRGLDAPADSADSADSAAPADPIDSAAVHSQRLITELCHFPPALAPDGAYLLDLQVAPVHMDAAPARPLLFTLARTPAA